jgi:putative endonuclease
MYYVYILKSLKDGKYYYGSTANLITRLRHHNRGKVRSTKGRTPFVVHYYEKYDSRSEAYRRELYLKSIDGFNWLRKEKII